MDRGGGRARAERARDAAPAADDGAATDRPGKAYRWPARDGTLLLIAALVMVALWLKAAGSGTPWLAVVALTFGVSGSLVLRAAGRR